MTRTGLLRSGFLAIACLGIAGAIPRQRQVMPRGAAASQLECPMPVERLDSLRTAPMPTDSTNTGVPMPRDTTSCRNPLFLLR